MSDEENEGEMDEGGEQEQAEEQEQEQEEQEEPEAAEAEETPVKQERQEEEKPKQLKPRPRPVEEDSGEKQLSDIDRAMIAAKEKKKAEDAAKMQEFEEQRAREREKEEEELRELKEKQERRKREREEEESIMAEQQAILEDRRRQDEEVRKAKQEEHKRRREEQKKKKEFLLTANFGMATGPSKRHFEIKKSETTHKDQFGNVVKNKADQETPEQHAESRRSHLARSVGQKNFSTMTIETLRQEIKQMHSRICKLEAAKYDCECRYKLQEYDLKELSERQRQANRNKLIKKGLDPEGANESQPPKVAVVSKYDRQIDRRSYGDRYELYNKPKHHKDKTVFHGTARPPPDWGCKNLEELENLRKNVEGTKRYVEAAPVEGAKPPVKFVPAKLPDKDAEESEPPPPVEATKQAAAPPANEEEEEE